MDDERGLRFGTTIRLMIRTSAVDHIQTTQANRKTWTRLISEAISHFAARGTVGPWPSGCSLVSYDGNAQRR